jgi:predicted amidohydrolase
MQDLKVLCLQTDIAWENPAKNRELLEIKILNHVEGHDLILLPETFNTGFPDFPSFISETMEGESVCWLAKMAAVTKAVIVATLIIEDNDRITNRLIWMLPDGHFETYDKRHVFSMAGEDTHISAGKKQLIVELNGWKIKPMICYDLRFPVWVKNRIDKEGNYEYDLSIFLANWPAVRSYPWRQLLISRAIENLSYVIGLNRVGYDPSGKYYDGHSLVVDPKGKIIEEATEGKERAITAELSFSKLTDLRQKFNVGLDWDDFAIVSP